MSYFDLRCLDPPVIGQVIAGKNFLQFILLSDDNQPPFLLRLLQRSRVYRRFDKVTLIPALPTMARSAQLLLITDIL